MAAFRVLCPPRSPPGLRISTPRSTSGSPSSSSPSTPRLLTWALGDRDEDEDVEFPIAAWDYFNRLPHVLLIKRKDWAGLSALISAGRTPAQQLAFVQSCRAPHSGASLLHLTILYGAFEEVGKPLVAAFGAPLVGLRYERPAPPPGAPPGCAAWYRPKFEGENALHLVIAKCAGDEEKAIAQLRFLIDNGPPSMVSARAEGTFFSMALPAAACLSRRRPEPAGKACMGETPLNFAVCLNLPRVARFLVEYGGADLTEGDSQNGWSPCHMAVHAERIAMLDFLEKLWASVRARCGGARLGQAVLLRPDARVGYVLREKDRGTTYLYMLLDRQRRSPLALAAAEGKLGMFESLWKGQSQVEWSFAEHTCKFYPLDDIELWPEGDAGEAHARGGGGGYAKMTAFEMLTHDDDEAGVIMRSGPFQELLRQKWLRYARKVFRLRLIGWCAMLALVTALLLRDPRAEPGWLWAAILCGAAVKLRMTLVDAWASGCARRFFCARGSTFIERYISLLFLACLAHWGAWKAAGGDAEGGAWRDSAFRARAMLPFFGYLYLIWFLLGYETTAPLTVMLWRILVGDIPAFALVLCVVLLAYVSHFFVGLGSKGGAAAFFAAVVDTVREMLNTEPHAYEDAEHNAHSFGALNFSFHVMGLLLTNLLVAMMNNTYSATLVDSLNQSCLERARIIAHIDRSLGVEEKREKARVDPYFVVKEVPGIPMRRWLRVEEVDSGQLKSAQEREVVVDAEKRDIEEASRLAAAPAAAGLAAPAKAAAAAAPSPGPQQRRSNKRRGSSAGGL